MDYADDQVDQAVKAGRKGVLTAYRDATLFKVIYGWGPRRTETASWICWTGAGIRRQRSSAGTGCCMSVTARRCEASRRGGAMSAR
jgi:hypothetical protein